MLRAWLIGSVDVVLTCVRPREKTKCRIERIAERLHRCVDVPQIVRVVDRYAPSVAPAAGAFGVTRRRPRTGGEVLITEERRRRPCRIEAAEAVMCGKFGIAGGEQGADA